MTINAISIGESNICGGQVPCCPKGTSPTIEGRWCLAKTPLTVAFATGDPTKGSGARSEAQPDRQEIHIPAGQADQELRQIEHQNFGCTAVIDADLRRFGDLERIAGTELDAVHSDFATYHVHIASPSRL